LCVCGDDDESVWIFVIHCLTPLAVLLIIIIIIISVVVVAMKQRLLSQMFVTLHVHRRLLSQQVQVRDPIEHDDDVADLFVCVVVGDESIVCDDDDDERVCADF